MIFASPIFLFLFLPATLALHAVVPQRLRNWVLLFTSLLFYAWGEPLFVGVLLLSMVLNHRVGIWIEERPFGPWFPKLCVALVTTVNLGLLVLFKYSELLVSAASALFGRLGIEIVELQPVHLPIGISFYTFHAVSYVVDIYRGKAKAQRSLRLHALYISFFPQLVAGPIVRYHEICDQLETRALSLSGFAAGVRRFIIGLAKKMLIANTVAIPAAALFGLPAQSLSAGSAWLGACCYALQIYFDFSGYSDMAIGLARMFGFTFPENFRWPYVARSMTEFWRRWHISLSSWFRDYLYIPLGGSRRGRLVELRNLLLVFALCGLWHGANWTFAIWGLYHGAFLIAERVGLRRLVERSPALLQHAYVVVAFTVGWVFFRSPNLADALVMLRAMAGFGGASDSAPLVSSFLDPASRCALAAGLFFSMPVGPWLRQRLAGRWPRFPVLHTALDLGLHVTLLFVAAALVAAGTHNPFIYYRF